MIPTFNYFVLQIAMKFPSAGLVYDYRLEDGGVSRRRNARDDDEDEQKSAVVSFIKQCFIYLNILISIAYLPYFAASVRYLRDGNILGSEVCATVRQCW